MDGIYRKVKECDCLKQRKIVRELNNSGLLESFDKYSFDKYKTNVPYQKYVKDMALKYINFLTRGNEKKWFMITGQIGSGKSHICTAISKSLIENGYEYKYISYPQDIPRITKRMDSGYIDVKEKAEKEYDYLKDVQVLYIDDYMKNGKVDKLFELINCRYLNKNLITIISSEKTSLEQREIDDAIASRIFERTGVYWIDIKTDPNKNYRYKGDKFNG